MFPGDKRENSDDALGLLANPDKYALQPKNSQLNISIWLEMSLLLDGVWFVIWLLIWAFLRNRHPIGFWSTYLIGIIVISILRYLLYVAVKNVKSVSLG